MPSNPSFSGDADGARPIRKSGRSREFFGFVFVGVVNTAASYAIYVCLHLFFVYAVAFTVAYVVGILLSYALNSVFVFRQPLHWAKAVQYPLIYAVQYVISMVFLYLLIEKFGLNSAYAPLCVVVFSVPVMFVLSRFVIKRDV